MQLNLATPQTPAPFSLVCPQIWDLASGKLKLSLTGHISTVRGVAVSTRSPYLFSCGEDKQVKCWDLEYNKVCPSGLFTLTG